MSRQPSRGIPSLLPGAPLPGAVVPSAPSPSALVPRALLSVLLLGALLLASGCTPEKASPGEAEFNVANAQIHAHKGEVAFGNSSAAKALAATFAKQLLEAEKATRPKDAKVIPDPGTGDRVLVFVQLNDDTVVFLARHPTIDKAKRKPREEMLERAWKTAEKTLGESAKEQGNGEARQLTVALRGMWSYNAIANGKQGSPPKLLIGSGVSSRSLYPAFASKR